jgi:CheY-like chemotaxis protein
MLRLLGKTRLLVLDDDPSMQKLVATLLRRAGHRVDVVSEAAQAIEKLGRYDYDALLLDIMTPTEGGMTVIRHLRKDKPALLKRVVLVTASPDSVLKSVSGDVFGIVRKPFDAKDLVSTIQKVVHK